MTLYHQDGTPATEQDILDAAGAIAQSRRKVRGGGRPPVIRKCKGCGVKLSAREMWRHKCPASP